MKDLGAFAQGIDQAVKAVDFDVVVKFVDAIKGDFEIAETYWTGKSQDAAKIAPTGGGPMAARRGR